MHTFLTEKVSQFLAGTYFVLLRTKIRSNCLTSPRIYISKDHPSPVIPVILNLEIRYNCLTSPHIYISKEHPPYPVILNLEIWYTESIVIQNGYYGESTLF